MTGREREARALRTLSARLKRDHGVVRQIHERLTRAVDRVGEDPDEIAVGAAALHLQHVYTAIEELLRRIATEIDGRPPSGAEWHRELIDQLAVDVPGIRPAVIGSGMAGDLDLLRRFRHRVRHAYAEPYVWGEMRDVLSAEQRVASGLSDVLDRFDRFLDQTIMRLENEPAEDS